MKNQNFTKRKRKKFITDKIDVPAKKSGKKDVLSELEEINITLFND